MKSETFEGSVSEYQGTPVSPAIKYSGAVEIFENLAELKASEEFPSDNEILKMVNNKRRTAAKQGEYQKQTADLKTKYEASEAFAQKSFMTNAKLMGLSDENAKLMWDQAQALKQAQG